MTPVSAEMEKKLKDELVGILRFWVYPDNPKRSDRWILNRSLTDAILKWHKAEIMRRMGENG